MYDTGPYYKDAKWIRWE